jgi:hypothetical protein
MSSKAVRPERKHVINKEHDEIKLAQQRGLRQQLKREVNINWRQRYEEPHRHARWLQQQINAADECHLSFTNSIAGMRQQHVAHIGAP